MKRIVVLIVSLFMFLSIISFGAYAEDSSTTDKNNLLNNDTVEEFYRKIESDDETSEILNEINPKNFIDEYVKNGNSGFTLTKAFNIIIKYFFKEIVIAFRVMISLIIIAIISALLKNLQESFSSTTISNIAFYSCYILIILILVKNFTSCVQIAKDAITDMGNFGAAIMPVFVFLITATGGVSQAATIDPIVAGVVNLAPKAYIDIILPLILLNFVLCFVDNISESHKVTELANLIKQITMWIQGIVLTLFVGILTIRSMTAGTFDAVALKTAKFAVDNFIPIVGKALSDSIATVAGYALIVKNAFGVLGLILLVFYFLVPIIKILVIVLIYKLSAAVIEPIVDKRIVNSISGAGGSLVLVGSMVICVSLMYFVLICIMINAGKFILGG